MLREIGGLAAAATTAAARGLSESGLSILAQAEKSTSGLKKLLEETTKRLTPVVIDVALHPNGSSPDNYVVDVDANDFVVALEDGSLVRPVIQVRATTNELDRALLADRLVEAFSPVSVRIQYKMDTIRENKRRRLEREANDRFWTSFAFTLDAILLTLLTGGGFLILLIGIDLLTVLMQIPGYIIRRAKESIGLTHYDHAEDAELAELSRKLERDQEVMRKAIAKVEIIIDESLSSYS